MNTEYKFGDPIWLCLDGRTNIQAIYVGENFGCAKIVTASSLVNILNVSFDLIKPRLTQGCFEGLWIKFPDQQPSCDTPYIVSIRDDSGDSTYHYTDVGWRSSSFLQDNAWIVDNEVNYNVEAWMFMPEPYKERND